MGLSSVGCSRRTHGGQAVTDNRGSKLVYVSLDEASQPRDGEVLINRWWVTHPDKGLAFYGPARIPQYHHNQMIAKVLCERLYPGHVVVQVPAVFVGY